MLEFIWFHHDPYQKNVFWIHKPLTSCLVFNAKNWDQRTWKNFKYLRQILAGGSITQETVSPKRSDFENVWFSGYFFLKLFPISKAPINTWDIVSLKCYTEYLTCFHVYMIFVMHSKMGFQNFYSHLIVLIRLVRLDSEKVTEYLRDLITFISFLKITEESKYSK